ncbi:MAG: ArgE/DapE family deacylase [Deltaproteobacteria bacterium]|nr:ArgE/DapE family deacylase [Deltaproteobacteria bacterium]
MTGKEKLLELIEENKEKIISFCSDIIKISSENPPGDTTRLVQFIGRYLHAEGLDYTVYAPQEKMPNIVGLLKGAAAGRRLVFNGHLDTYPCGDASRWKYDPLSGMVADGKIYGRGASDMKGGCTASIMAFTFLSKLTHLFNGEIVLTLVSDEETGGKWGTVWLLDNVPMVSGDAMLNAEPTSTAQISFAEKGRIFLEVIAKGIGAHGAYVHLGDNAIKKMTRFLSDLEHVVDLDISAPGDVTRVLEEGRQIVDKMKGAGATDVLMGITCNIGKIDGGLMVNMIPENCRAEVDIRLPQGVTCRQVLEEIDQILTRHQGISYRVIQAMEPNYTPPDHEICLLLQKNAEFVRKTRVILNSGIGGSDAKHFRQRGIPCALYGPTSYNMAGTDEHITVEDLLTTTKSHALTSLEYLQG